MKKLSLYVFLGLMFCNVVNAKIIKSVTGYSFEINDDWNITGQADVDVLLDKVAPEHKTYLEKTIKMTQIYKFEVLFNERYVPDFITITSQQVPANTHVTKSNVQSYCNQLLKINEYASKKKQVLYECYYLDNPLAKNGALFMSIKDSISKENKDVRTNLLMMIFGTNAISFGSSCSDYCKEINKSLALINTTIKK